MSSWICPSLSRKGYALLGHTADVALRAEGSTRGDLFLNAARGLRTLWGLKAGSGGRPEGINLEADNVESLFVAWLEEIIFRLSARGELLVGARFSEMTANNLKGTARWRSLMKNEKPRTEVKAATYHGLKVLRRSGGFSATVILDV